MFDFNSNFTDIQMQISFANLTDQQIRELMAILQTKRSAKHKLAKEWNFFPFFPSIWIETQFYREVIRMKKLIAFVFALVCVLGLVGCSDKNMTFDIGEANKINIKSGLTGDEVIIADNEFIQSITENINSLRFDRTLAADGKVGYAYMLTWFDTDDNQIAKITITDENGYQISHNGYYYKAGADLSIDTALIGEMLNIALSSAPALLRQSKQYLSRTESK